MTMTILEHKRHCHQSASSVLHLLSGGNGACEKQGLSRSECRPLLFAYPGLLTDMEIRNTIEKLYPRGAGFALSFRVGMMGFRMRELGLSESNDVGGHYWQIDNRTPATHHHVRLRRCRRTPKAEPLRVLCNTAARQCLGLC